MSGSLALLLHAHLPFVRHPERDSADEERWLFEAVSESYIPLIRMLTRLLNEGITSRLTLSVSPTLCAMLEDELLKERCFCYLQQRIALAQSLCEKGDEKTAPRNLCEFYLQFYSEAIRTFVEWEGDLLAQLRSLQQHGALELIATAATHAILPIHRESAHAQVAIGQDVFRRIFQTAPHGFWLPECAYTPGLESLLAEREIRWFVIAAHALTSGQPPARAGVFAPCFTSAGPAAFARDPEASRQIWDAQYGYPGDFSYRDFYRDLGFDLAHLPAEEQGKFSGLKFRRVTGRDGAAKEFYDPRKAQNTAREHARHFVQQQCARLEALPTSGTENIIVSPFDAELFGHWWFEGPFFLEEVIREMSQASASLVTPSDYLSVNPTHQVIQLATSSWGDGGCFEVWLDDNCSWIYPPLQRATARMQSLVASSSGSISTENSRWLRQLARELLLAQASDWPFLIRNGTAADYAARRVSGHIMHFEALADALAHGCGKLELLAECEAQDNLFPDVDWRHFLKTTQRTA